MATTAPDLLEPLGRLTPSLFPGEAEADLTARLDAYIAEADARVGDTLEAGDVRDRAVKAWAYHRAFAAIAVRLAGSPESVSLDDQGSAKWGTGQARTFSTLAERALEDFESLLLPVGEAPPETGRTTAVPNRYVW